jgi:L-iditol 2-dehydrogenase
MYYNNRDVRLAEAELPMVGDDEVLIRVRACGICGSDLLEWYRIKRAPLVLGHEVTGEVVEVGKGIRKFKKGDRVFAIHHVPCEDCAECFRGHETACKDFQSVNNFVPGGFAEYLKIKGKSVRTGMIHLPADLSYEEGTFIEPLGTVIRGQRACDIKPGDSVLVIGSGLAGLLHIQCADASGAIRIMAVDIHQKRLEAAQRLGATNVFLANEDIPALVRKVNQGRLADKVILCAGAKSAALQALSSVEKGGTVLFFAVPKPEEKIELDINPFWREDITIKTSYGSSPRDHYQALQLISAGKVLVKEMISHRFPLEKIQQAFNEAARGDDCLKVLITMPEISQ